MDVEAGQRCHHGVLLRGEQYQPAGRYDHPVALPGERELDIAFSLSKKISHKKAQKAQSDQSFHSLCVFCAFLWLIFLLQAVSPVAYPKGKRAASYLRPPFLCSRAFVALCLIGLRRQRHQKLSCRRLW